MPLQTLLQRSCALSLAASSVMKSMTSQSLRSPGYSLVGRNGDKATGCLFSVFSCGLLLFLCLSLSVSAYRALPLLLLLLLLLFSPSACVSVPFCLSRCMCCFPSIFVSLCVCVPLSLLFVSLSLPLVPYVVLSLRPASLPFLIVLLLLLHLVSPFVSFLGVQKVREVARYIARIFIECGYVWGNGPPTEDEQQQQQQEREVEAIEAYVNNFKHALVSLTYGWASGESFASLIRNTSLYEGTVIRCMRRLEELLRQLACASKAIGNEQLEAKCVSSIRQLRRGIIFSSSLYL